MRSERRLRVAVTHERDRLRVAGTSADCGRVPACNRAREHGTADGQRSAREGETLLGTNEAESGSAAAYSYRWHRCDASGSGCDDVDRRPEQSYAVRPADVVADALGSFTDAGSADCSAPGGGG